MSFRIEKIDLNVLNMHTRMPFKYGIATLTALPHLFVRVTANINGQRQAGLASDGLPPKWFTKNPDSHVRDDLAEMIDVIQHACDVAVEIEESDTPFDLWQQLYTMQHRWGDGRGYPPLLWGLGVSLVERAVIDAFCRATQTKFGDALRNGALGLRMGDLNSELVHDAVVDLLPAEACRSVYVRHTVGLVDPLTDGDIPANERIDDGLPQSLEACIDAYGLTHFKIKLCGDVQRDIDRMRQLASIITARTDTFAFSLDGNEQYEQVEPFRQVWSTLVNEPSIAPFLRGLLFVEQPFHRDIALGDELGQALQVWSDRPAIIIDESDGSIDSAAKALRLGYAGTSHKNCKGVFKGVTNACLLEQRRRSQPDQPFILSGEDLANVGPIALLEDLTVAANLGLMHVERNGHHYFRGLSMYGDHVQDAVLEQHSDLYRRHDAGFATLAVEGGAVKIDSVIDSPFGCGLELDSLAYQPLEQWEYTSLEDGEA